MRFVKQAFANERIILDYNEFDHCVFTTCTLVYRATGAVQLVNCAFDNCQWVFEGPAADAIQFMQAIYAGAGPGGRELMEATFEKIRGKRPPAPLPDQPSPSG